MKLLKYALHVKANIENIKFPYFNVYMNLELLVIKSLNGKKCSDLNIEKIMGPNEYGINNSLRGFQW